jgi:murein DD-endopeptidase MepM/ murein hydrolase activator NlpD
MKPKLRLPFKGDFLITFPFGGQSDNEEIKKKFHEWGTRGHHGIDYGLPQGTEVLSCDRGAVIQSGHNLDWGISVTLKHRWGISIYAHLQQSKVHVGDKVKVGQVIGLSGQSGAAFGGHLHFGIKLNHPDHENGYLGFIDPRAYF